MAKPPTRDKGIDNLWFQPLDGSKGKQLTDFTWERIWDFHRSFDGSQLPGFEVTRTLMWS